MKANFLLVPFCIPTCSTKQGNDAKGEAGRCPCTRWEHGCLSAAWRVLWVPNTGGFCFAESRSSMDHSKRTDGEREQHQLCLTCGLKKFPGTTVGLSKYMSPSWMFPTFSFIRCWFCLLLTSEFAYRDWNHPYSRFALSSAKSVTSKKFYCFPLI